MPLTPQEQAELDTLNAELGAPPKSGGLSQQEQAELDALNAELGPPPQPEAPSAPETALQQFGQAVTFGHVPEIVGGITKAIGRYQGLPEEALAGTTESTRAEFQRGVQQNPYAALGGQAAGLLASVPLMPGATAATLGGKVLQGAKVGAAMGALQNPAEQGKDVTDISERAEQAVKGGIFGAALPVVAEGVSKVTSTIAKSPQFKATVDKLRRYAGEKAFKSLGPNQKDVFLARSKAVGEAAKNRTSEIGNTAMEYGVIGKIPSSYSSLADRAVKQAEAVGAKLGDALDEIVAKADDIANGSNLPAIPGQRVRVGIDKALIAQELKDALIDTSGVPGVGKDNRVISKLVDEFTSGDNILDIKAAQKMKEAVGKRINWRRDPRADVPVSEKFYHELYSKLRDGIEDAAESVAGSLGKDARENFIKLKKAYGNLKTAAKIANEKSGREFANRYISMSDYQSGQLGGALGLAISFAKGGDIVSNVVSSAVGSAVGALSNKGARRFANQIQGKSVKQISNIIQKSPGAINSLAKIVKDNPAIIVKSKNELERRKAALGGE